MHLLHDQCMGLHTPAVTHSHAVKPCARCAGNGLHGGSRRAPAVPSGRAQLRGAFLPQPHATSSHGSGLAVRAATGTGAAAPGPEAGEVVPDVPANDSISQIIADVLNEERKRLGSPMASSGADLLSSIDAMGLGLRTTVTRTWEGSDAWVELGGTWEQGNDARRTALLPVYQELLQRRSTQLGALCDRVERARPRVLLPETMTKVREAMSARRLMGVTQALGIPDLMQLGVALLPVAALRARIRAAAGQAQEEVAREPWFARDPARRTSLEAEVTRMVAAWEYKLSLAVLRLHHAPAIIMTAKLSRDLEARRAVGGGGDKKPVFKSLWQPTPAASEPKPPQPKQSDEEQYVRAQMQYCKQQVVTGPSCGRVGSASFGRGGARPSLVAGTAAGARRDAAGGLARGALLREGGGSGSAGFGVEVLQEFAEVDATNRTYIAAAAASKTFTMSAAVTFERLLRAGLLDDLCEVAEVYEEMLTGIPVPHDVCQHAASIPRNHPEQVRRFVVVSVEGQELEWMRQQARARGASFLRRVDPYIGAMLCSRPEWEYLIEGPHVWMRFAHLPPSTDSARLTLFWPDLPSSPAPAALPSASSSSSSSSRSTSTVGAGTSSHDSTGVAEEAGEVSPSDVTSNGAKPRDSSKAAAATARKEVRVELALSLPELQSFLQALVELLPRAVALASTTAASSSGHGATHTATPLGASRAGAGNSTGHMKKLQPGPWQGPACLQVRYSPAPVHSAVAPASSSSSSSGSSSQDSLEVRRVTPTCFEVRWAVVRMGVRKEGTAPQDATSSTAMTPPVHLTEAQVSSLISLYDEVSGRFTELLPPPPMSTTLTPSVATLGSTAPSTARAAAAVVAQGLAALAVGVAVVQALLRAHVSGPGLQLHWATSQPTAALVDRQPTSATHGPASAAAAVQPRQVQPVNAELDVAAMSQLCEAVRAQVDGRMWLPVAELEEGQQQQQPAVLAYQVVLERSSGQVVGCMPCDPASASWYHATPFAAQLRSPKCQALVDAYLAAARPDAPNPALPGTLPRMTEKAHFSAPPPQGMVVLSVQLHQDMDQAQEIRLPSSKRGGFFGWGAKQDAPAGQQQAEDTGTKRGWFGGLGGKQASNKDDGKGAVRKAKQQQQSGVMLTAPLTAVVRPWTDADSVITWLKSSADVAVTAHQKQQLAAEAVAVAAPGSKQLRGVQLAGSSGRAGRVSTGGLEGEQQGDAEHQEAAARARLASSLRPAGVAATHGQGSRTSGVGAAGSGGGAAGLHAVGGVGTGDAGGASPGAAASEAGLTSVSIEQMLTAALKQLGAAGAGVSVTSTPVPTAGHEAGPHTPTGPRAT